MYLKCNVFGVSVSNVQVRLGHNHIECIGLYTELIGRHCLGAESQLILEEAL